MMEKISVEVFANKPVVIIDDDPNSLDIAKMLLEFADATVVTAINGQEGLARIRETQPVLVISDISMPVMDGWQLVKEVRADEIYKDLMMVALTAHAMVGDREKVLEAGFNGYISKPLFPATFTDELLRVVNRAKQEQPLEFSLIGE